jgi:hypothetical protein
MPVKKQKGTHMPTFDFDLLHLLVAGAVGVFILRARIKNEVCRGIAMFVSAGLATLLSFSGLKWLLTAAAGLTVVTFQTHPWVLGVIGGIVFLLVLRLFPDRT